MDIIPISINDQIMSYYSVQQETLTSDGNFLGSTETFEYYNLIQRSNFPFYENENMHAGI